MVPLLPKVGTICFMPANFPGTGSDQIGKVKNDSARQTPCRVWLALEWKGIDYDTMFINLRDKPKWFMEMVPKGLVPVAKIKDKLLPESYEILKVPFQTH